MHKEALVSKIRELASVIGAPDSILPEVDVGNHFADPYVLIEGIFLCYVVRERDEILQQRQTTDIDELLYWIFDKVTFRMAEQFEVNHRISGQDSRRLLFSHQLQSLETLCPEWRTKKQQEIDRILEKHPFGDILRWTDFWRKVPLERLIEFWTKGPF